MIHSYQDSNVTIDETRQSLDEIPSMDEDQSSDGIQSVNEIEPIKEVQTDYKPSKLVMSLFPLLTQQKQKENVNTSNRSEVIANLNTVETNPELVEKVSRLEEKVKILMNENKELLANNQKKSNLKQEKVKSIDCSVIRIIFTLETF